MNVSFKGNSPITQSLQPITRKASQLSFTGTPEVATTVAKGVNYRELFQRFLKTINWQGFCQSIKALWGKITGIPAAIKPSLDRGNEYLGKKITGVLQRLKPVS